MGWEDGELTAEEERYIEALVAVTATRLDLSRWRAKEGPSSWPHFTEGIPSYYDQHPELAPLLAALERVYGLAEEMDAARTRQDQHEIAQGLQFDKLDEPLPDGDQLPVLRERFIAALDEAEPALVALAAQLGLPAG